MPKEKKQEIVVGIDIHPDSFSAAVFNAGEKEKAAKTFVCVDIKEWEKWLKKNIIKGSVLIFEAGSNTFEYAAKAVGLGYNTVVLESQKVGKIGKLYCKTDKEDAVKIAKIYLSGLMYDEVWQPDPETRTRREVLHAYYNARTDCTRAKNRLINFLNGHGIRLKKNTCLTLVETEEQLLKEHPFTENAKEILHSYFNDIRRTNETRNKMKDIMIKETLKNEDMLKLTNLCGIRVLCAYAIIAAIGDIKRFKNPKKLVAYLGLTPSISKSGAKSKNLGLSNTGRRDVKADLIQAAQSIFRSKSQSTEALRKWAKTLCARRNRNVAIGGIARKLVVAVWYILNGHIPKTLSQSGRQEIRRKLMKIINETDHRALFKFLGYRTKESFLEEYIQILMMITGNKT